MKLSRLDFWLGLVVMIVLAGIPFFQPSDFLLNLLTLIMIWGIFAIGFDFVFGLMGMVSFGHASFLGIGGYALTLATNSGHVSFGAALLLAIVCAGLCAWLFSFFALRVSGIFFALVTLALGQLLYILADSKLRAWTGGADGLTVGRPDIAGLDFFDPALFYVYVTLLFVAVIAFVAMLRASPFGRVIAGIRQNEIRAEQLGFNVHRYKQITFIISGAISGLAGGLLASLLTYMNPQMLHWTTSGDVIIMTLLGGAGTLWGPVVGVLAFEALKEWLSGQTEHWYGLLGLIFILATLFFPRGIVGEIQGRREAKQAQRKAESRSASREDRNGAAS